jgi:DNA (cytosine-5)-methyltransferase 1
MTLTVGSLFSGIGGLDLGLERAGMNVIWQSEIDPYACRVLKKHWPEVPNYGDIKAINWGDIVRPDVLCGGYPCQPFSNAGKRKGTDDPRHLWPWVRQAISELRPRYAILENVRGHLSMGGLSVIGELASIGYDAEWRIVSAASVGANHRRDRLIIVAYPNNTRSHSAQINSANTRVNALGRARRCSANVANADSQGRNWNRLTLRQETPHTVFTSRSTHTQWDEITANWETEPNVGRVANGVPSRVDRLRGLGNAVVPQVAEVIGRLVIEHSQAC